MPVSTVLRPYQDQAVSDVLAALRSGNRRATLRMPCGTGKTVVAAHVIPTVGPRRTVFCVPTLQLGRQTVERIREIHPHLRAVYVDSVRDENHTTDSGVLAQLLRSERGPLLIVSTYDSVDVTKSAAEKTGTVYDLLVCDEAHRTAGLSDRKWSLPAQDAFPALRRLFMTATPRFCVLPATADTSDFEVGEFEIVSMDDPRVYGVQIEPLTFRAAIEEDWLCDYRVAVIAIHDTEAIRNLRRAAGSVSEYDVLDLAAHLALARATTRYPPLSSVLVAHNLIAKSRQWSSRLPAVQDAIEPRWKHPDRREIRSIHIDQRSSRAEVESAIDALAHPGKSLVVVSNCHMFSEGIDVPALDAVVFAAPRSSAPDIVQVAGRAMRKHPGNSSRRALIVLPILVLDEDDATQIELRAAASTRRTAWNVLNALAEQDELLFQSLVRLRTGVGSRSRIDDGPLSIDLPEGLPELAKLVTLRTAARSVPAYDRTLFYLGWWASVKGNSEPTSDDFHGYPLRTAVAKARRDYHAGRMSPAHIHAFEELEDFTWRLPTRPIRRSVAEWTSLVKQQIAESRLYDIPPDQKVMDPVRGVLATVGSWVADVRSERIKLTPSEYAELVRIMTPPAA